MDEMLINSFDEDSSVKTERLDYNSEGIEKLRSMLRQKFTTPVVTIWPSLFGPCVLGVREHAFPDYEPVYPDCDEDGTEIKYPTESERVHSENCTIHLPFEYNLELAKSCNGDTIDQLICIVKNGKFN